MHFGVGLAGAPAGSLLFKCLLVVQVPSCATVPLCLLFKYSTCEIEWACFTHASRMLHACVCKHRQQLETSSLDLARAHTVIKGHEAQQMHISCRVQEMLEHISQALAWCDRVSLDSQLAYHSHSQALRQVVVCEQDRISNSLQSKTANSGFENQIAVLKQRVLLYEQRLEEGEDEVRKLEEQLVLLLVRPPRSPAPQ